MVRLNSKVDKIILKYFHLFYFCMNECFACMYAWYPQRLEEGIGVPDTGETGGCATLCVFGELNQGTLEEQ